MEGVTHNIVLEMTGGSTRVLKAKQCDTNSRFVHITLMDGAAPWTIPFECEAYLYVLKPDKTVVFSRCNIIGRNILVAPLTEQTLAVYGTAQCELYIKTADGDIKSQTFQLIIEKMIYDKTAIASANEFNELLETLITIQAAIHRAGDAAQKAEKGATKADTAAELAEESVGMIQTAVDAAGRTEADRTAAEAIRDHIKKEKSSFPGYSKRDSDCQYANAFVGTAAGRGCVLLTDAWTAPAAGITIKGSTHQKATKGTNLLDFEKLAPVTSDVVMTVKDKGYVINIQGASMYTNLRYADDSLIGKTVYMMAEIIKNTSEELAASIQISWIDTDGITQYRDMGKTGSRQVSIPSDVTNVMVKLISNNTKGVVPSNVTFIGARICYADGTEWEEYSGRTESPDNDYPQAIESSGDVPYPDYQNLNKWTIIKPEGIRSIKFDEMKTNSIDYFGISGWEHIYRAFSTVSGREYTLFYDFEFISSEVNGGVMRTIITNEKPTANGAPAELAKDNITIVKDVPLPRHERSITFTATSAVTYVDFCLGSLHDGYQYKINIGSILFVHGSGNPPRQEIQVVSSVGSKNYLKGSRDFATQVIGTAENQRLSGYWSINSGYKTYKDGDFTAISISREGQETVSILNAYSPIIPIDKNMLENGIKISFCMKVDDYNAWDNKKPFIFEIYNSQLTRIIYTDVSMHHTSNPQVIDGEWVCITYERPDLFAGSGSTNIAGFTKYDAAYIGLRFTLFQNGSLHFKMPKLVSGDNDTGVWTPHYDDITPENAGEYRPLYLNKVKLPVSLNGKDGIYDTLQKHNGIWGINRCWRKKTISAVPLGNIGSETGWKNTSFVISGQIPDCKYIEGYNTTANILSDRYTVSTPEQVVSVRNNDSIGIGGSGNARRIYIGPFNHIAKGDKAAFKVWLDANPFEIMYPLEVPEWEPLPDDIQEQFNGLLIYSGEQSAIYTVSDPAPDISIKYVQDTNIIVGRLQAGIPEREADVLAAIDRLKADNNLI